MAKALPTAVSSTLATLIRNGFPKRLKRELIARASEDEDISVPSLMGAWMDFKRGEWGEEEEEEEELPARFPFEVGQWLRFNSGLSANKNGAKQWELGLERAGEWSNKHRQGGPSRGLVEEAVIFNNSPHYILVVNAGLRTESRYRVSTDDIIEISEAPPYYTARAPTYRSAPHETARAVRIPPGTKTPESTPTVGMTATWDNGKDRYVHTVVEVKRNGRLIVLSHPQLGMMNATLRGTGRYLPKGTNFGSITWHPATVLEEEEEEPSPWAREEEEEEEEEICAPCPTPASRKARPFSLGSLSGLRGEATSVVFPSSSARGRDRLGGFYALVPLDQVRTSHHPFTFERTPGYPQELQERDYLVEELEQRKVRANVADFDARFVTSDTPTAIDGPPIIDHAGNVLGGNSRAMVIKRVYDRELGLRDEYITEIRLDGECLGLGGLDSAEILGLMLVRVINLEGHEAKRISRDLNRPFTQELAPEAEGASLGKMLSTGLLGVLASEPDLKWGQMLKRKGAEIVRELRISGVITNQNEAQWLRKESGRTIPELSKRGRARLEGALVGYLVPEPEVLNLTPKGYMGLYYKIAPPALQIARQLPFPWGSAGLNDSIRLATYTVPRIADLKMREAADWFANLELFEEGVWEDHANIDTARLLYWLMKLKRTPAKGARQLEHYLALGKKANTKQGGLFGGGPPPMGKEEAIQLSLLLPPLRYDELLAADLWYDTAAMGLWVSYALRGIKDPSAKLLRSRGAKPEKLESVAAPAPVASLSPAAKKSDVMSVLYGSREQAQNAASGDAGDAPGQVSITPKTWEKWTGEGGPYWWTPGVPGCVVLKVKGGWAVKETPPGREERAAPAQIAAEIFGPVAEKVDALLESTERLIEVAGIRARSKAGDDFAGAVIERISQLRARMNEAGADLVDIIEAGERAGSRTLEIVKLDVAEVDAALEDLREEIAAEGERVAAAARAAAARADAARADAARAAAAPAPKRTARVPHWGTRAADEKPELTRKKTFDYKGLTEIPGGRGGKYWARVDVDTINGTVSKWRALKMKLGDRFADAEIAPERKGWPGLPDDDNGSPVRVMMVYWIPKSRRKDFAVGRRHGDLALDPIWTWNLGAIRGGYSWEPGTREQIGLLITPDRPDFSTPAASEFPAWREDAPNSAAVALGQLEDYTGTNPEVRNRLQEAVVQGLEQWPRPGDYADVVKWLGFEDKGYKANAARIFEAMNALVKGLPRPTPPPPAPGLAAVEGFAAEVARFVSQHLSSDWTQEESFEADFDPALMLTWTTREHGDVGYDQPGELDVEEGHRVVELVEAQFRNRVVAYVDTVDEWTNLKVKIPFDQPRNGNGNGNGNGKRKARITSPKFFAWYPRLVDAWSGEVEVLGTYASRDPKAEVTVRNEKGETMVVRASFLTFNGNGNGNGKPAPKLTLVQPEQKTTYKTLPDVKVAIAQLRRDAGVPRTTVSLIPPDDDDRRWTARYDYYVIGPRGAYEILEAHIDPVPDARFRQRGDTKVKTTADWRQIAYDAAKRADWAGAVQAYHSAIQTHPGKFAPKGSASYADAMALKTSLDAARAQLEDAQAEVSPSALCDPSELPIGSELASRIRTWADSPTKREAIKIYNAAVKLGVADRLPTLDEIWEFSPRAWKQVPRLGWTLNLNDTVYLITSAVNSKGQRGAVAERCFRGKEFTPVAMSLVVEGIEVSLKSVAAQVGSDLSSMGYGDKGEDFKESWVHQKSRAPYVPPVASKPRLVVVKPEATTADDWGKWNSITPGAGKVFRTLKAAKGTIYEAKNINPETGGGNWGPVRWKKNVDDLFGREPQIVTWWASESVPGFILAVKGGYRIVDSLIEPASDERNKEPEAPTKPTVTEADREALMVRVRALRAAAERAGLKARMQNGDVEAGVPYEKIALMEEEVRGVKTPSYYKILVQEIAELEPIIASFAPPGVKPQGEDVPRGVRRARRVVAWSERNAAAGESGGRVIPEIVRPFFPELIEMEAAGKVPKKTLNKRTTKALLSALSTGIMEQGFATGFGPGRIIESGKGFIYDSDAGMLTVRVLSGKDQGKSTLSFTTGSDRVTKNAALYTKEAKAFEEKEERRVERLGERAARKMEQAGAAFERSREITKHIPMGQPILVGHHSEKRHRRDLERSHSAGRKGHELYKEGKALEARAEGAAARSAISSHDPASVPKLQAKIDKLRRKQELMKSVNKIVRKKKLSDAEKRALMIQIAGITPGLADQLLEPDYGGRKGFPSYALQNNNAKIKAAEGRIKTIEQLNEDDTAEVIFEGLIVRDNVEDNFVQLEYDAKPSQEIRNRLKGGYRWSRNRGTWQRNRSPRAFDNALSLAFELGVREGDLSERKDEREKPPFAVGEWVRVGDDYDVPVFTGRVVNLKSRSTYLGSLTNPITFWTVDVFSPSEDEERTFISDVLEQDESPTHLRSVPEAGDLPREHEDVDEHFWMFIKPYFTEEDSSAWMKRWKAEPPGSPDGFFLLEPRAGRGDTWELIERGDESAIDELFSREVRDSYASQPDRPELAHERIYWVPKRYSDEPKKAIEEGKLLPVWERTNRDAGRSGGVASGGINNPGHQIQRRRQRLEWETQSVLVPMDEFTQRQATRWVRDHDFATDDIDGFARGDFYRYRQADPDDFRFIRTLTLPNGVQYLRGPLR